MILFDKIISMVNLVLWDYLLLFILCGTGLYFTIKLKFIQIFKFKEAFCLVFGNVKLFGAKADKDGITSFQSLATAISAQIGTGNVVGAASAIASGGPGAIFWMWVSAFLGMSTIFVEATLSQKYKTKVNGYVTGGPVYYIRAAFKGTFGKIMAGFFSVFIIIALGLIGNMVQANSITDAFDTAFNANKLVVGLLIGALAGFIFFGGIKRIVSITEKLVPIMAVMYILGSLILIFANIRQLPSAFQMIFVGAFRPSAVMGGVIGITVQKSIRYGVARGLFSNEAGMGSTPHAHALAKVDHPCEQGLVAMMGAFIDTFVLLTLTSLVILMTGSFQSGSGNVGAALAQEAFHSFYGHFGDIFVAFSLLFFAFSTIIGWYFFGEQNVKYLFGNKAVKIYSLLVIVFIVLGSVLKVQVVWDLSDMFNGFMVIPNIIGVLALSGVVVKLYQDYRINKKLQL